MEIPEATGFVQIHATTFFIDIDSPVDFHDQLNLTNASLRPEDSLSDTTFASLFHLRHDICFTLFLALIECNTVLPFSGENYFASNDAKSKLNCEIAKG